MVGTGMVEGRGLRRAGCYEHAAVSIFKIAQSRRLGLPVVGVEQ